MFQFIARFTPEIHWRKFDDTIFNPSTHKIKFLHLESKLCKTPALIKYRYQQGTELTFRFTASVWPRHLHMEKQDLSSERFYSRVLFTLAKSTGTIYMPLNALHPQSTSKYILHHTLFQNDSFKFLLHTRKKRTACPHNLRLFSVTTEVRNWHPQLCKRTNSLFKQSYTISNWRLS